MLDQRFRYNSLSSYVERSRKVNKKRKERAKDDANNKEDREKKTMEKLQAVNSIKNHFA